MKQNQQQSRVDNSHIHYESFAALWDPLNQILILDSLGTDGHSYLYYLHGWDFGLNVECVVKGRCEELQDKDPLAWVLESGDPMIAAWRDTIPKLMLVNTLALPGRWLNLLSLSSEHNDVAQLLAANPLLLWLYYSRLMPSSGGNVAEFINSMGLKRREMLRAIGFEGSERQVRLLEKAKAQRMSAVSTVQLLELDSKPELKKYFAHTETVSLTALNVLRRYPALSQGKINQLIDQFDNSDNCKLLVDVHKLQGVRSDRILSCTSIKALSDLYEEALLEKTRRQLPSIIESGAVVALPRPPLSETDEIEAIKTVEDLSLEAEFMENCIWTYLPRMLAGQYYVYHMNYPEHLTIGLAISRTGKIELDEIKALGNGEPRSPEAMTIVREWLKRSLGKAID